MSPIRIDFRQLAAFVLACQNERIGDTARELDLSISTLSVSLRSLERSLGLALFLRKGNYLVPAPAAFWLFQRATSLLHAESLVRAMAREEFPSAEIAVEVHLSFNIGRFAKALSRTVEDMYTSEPRAAVDFRFAPVDGPPAALRCRPRGRTTAARRRGSRSGTCRTIRKARRLSCGTTSGSRSVEPSPGQSPPTTRR